MMKKTTANIFLILALMLLTIVMVSCGGNSGSEPEGGAAEDNTVSPRLVQRGELEVMPFSGAVRNDANNNPGAVIDVYASDVRDMVFEGSLIIDKENIQNIKWRLYVYVPHGSRENKITICKPGYLPLSLKFQPGDLMAKKLYRLELDVRGDVQSNTVPTQQTVTVQQPTVTQPTHDYVDLGLPSGTLWATTNVGADNPWDYGDYFAWGETTTKSNYDWSTYKYANGDYKKLTKYCSASSYGNNGYTDSCTTLEKSDDAATANWGSNWCMPTVDQIKELKKKCNWTWTSENGINGYKVTGPNDNSLFLPATGFHYGADFYCVSSPGFYWLRSFNETNPSCAWDLWFDSSYVDWGNNDRCGGLTVRPVWCKK